MRTLERQCNAAKQKMSSYLQQSKRYETSNPEKSRTLREKAERIDMSYCNTLKEDKDTLEQFRQRKKETKTKSKSPG